jgi:hypothetical protein
MAVLFGIWFMCYLYFANDINDSAYFVNCPVSDGSLCKALKTPENPPWYSNNEGWYWELAFSLWSMSQSQYVTILLNFLIVFAIYKYYWAVTSDLYRDISFKDLISQDGVNAEEMFTALKDVFKFKITKSKLWLALHYNPRFQIWYSISALSFR